MVSERRHVEGTTVRTLEEEIEFIHCRDAAVNHCARPRVTVTCSVLCVSRVEASMMAFAADDDGELRLVSFLRGTELLKGLLYPRHFLRHHDVELTLGSKLVTLKAEGARPLLKRVYL